MPGIQHSKDRKDSALNRPSFSLPYTSLEELKSKLKEVSLDQNKLVLQALAQAQDSHCDQPRDDGGPCLEQHIFAVTLSVINHEVRVGHRVSAKLVAACLTHDVPEDDPDIPLSQFRMLYGQSEAKPIKPGRSVADFVDPLTKRRPEEFPGETEETRRSERDKAYYAGLNQAAYESLIIKLGDRENNIYSLHLCEPEKIIRKIIETETHYLPWAADISPIYYESISARVTELRQWLREVGHGIV